MVAQVPLKPLAVLEDRAKELIAQLGYTDAPVGEARGFLFTGEYVSMLFERTTGVTVGAAQDRRVSDDSILLSRQSAPDGRAVRRAVRSYDDPPLTVTGMTSVILDSRGQLTQFIAVPPQFESEPPAGITATNWQPLFAAAGLPMASFQRVADQWVP